MSFGFKGLNLNSVNQLIAGMVFSLRYGLNFYVAFSRDSISNG